MKRILTLLLALAMLFCLVACGGDKESTPTGENTGATANTTENTNDPTDGTQDSMQGTTDTAIGEGNDSSTETTKPSIGNAETTNPTHTHEYVDKVTAATCTKEGYTLHTCSCGDSYSDNKSAAEGHSFGEWNTTKEPTTTATGTAERKCSKCNERETKVLGKLIDNHKHNYTTKITIQPTCKGDGQKTYSCSCGDTYSESVASVDHQYGHKVTNPTCTNEGYTTYTCTVCGNSYRDNFTHSAGHDWVASTCTTPSTCRVCGATEGSADGHNYSRWDIWDYPTCTEEGHEVSWCTRCENRELRPVKPRGHKYVAGICSVCGDDNNVYANVSGVTLNQTTLNLYVGDTSQLKATVTPENAKDKTVKWSTSDNAVAQISSSGKITAKGKGSATITVTTVDGNYSATCTVTVAEPPLTVRISMGVGHYMGSSGSAQGVFAEAIASGGSGNYVEYYLKVYYNGNLVAEGAKEEIIVTLANGTYTAEVYVKDSSGNETTASKTFSCQGY